MTDKQGVNMNIDNRTFSELQGVNMNIDNLTFSELQGVNMNIDNLTFGELKQIAAMFAGQQAAKPTNQPHQFVGKYCIARGYAAGVHAGEVISVDGENVILKNSRRLWEWTAKDGIALSGVAQNGIKRDKCKIDSLNPELYLTGVCELIPCSKHSRESIDA